jgi:hypothetical protein
MRRPCQGDGPPAEAVCTTPTLNTEQVETKGLAINSVGAHLLAGTRGIRAQKAVRVAGRTTLTREPHQERYKRLFELNQEVRDERKPPTSYRRKVLTSTAHPTRCLDTAREQETCQVGRTVLVACLGR